MKLSIRPFVLGIALCALIGIVAFGLAKIPFFLSLHLSPLILSVLVGMALAPWYKKSGQIGIVGVLWCGKRLLRLGIVLFGFQVTLQSLLGVGVEGFLIALLVVAGIFTLGSYLGVKLLGLDRETSMLIACGSAVCGAAAILALESLSKTPAHKTAIAVGVVVLFGLLSMFLYPLVYEAGFIPLSPLQEGIYTGATLHEVANVIGASANLPKEAQEAAVIVKMIRVILLVPLLLLLSFTILKHKEKGSNEVAIPWFALLFLGAILLGSLSFFPSWLRSLLQSVSLFSLTLAMGALGLVSDFSKLQGIGAKALALGAILWGVLLFGGLGLVKLLA